MTDKPVLQPGPDHPITVAANPNRVVVTAGGQVVASSTRSLTLREAKYPAVHYIPMAEVDQSLLERTATETYCPYKGDASYYSIKAGTETSVDAVWVYESPYAPVAEIKDHVAFYPDRVEAITEQPAG
jgi:uncharacterized protein (DUF427 family)